MKLYIVCIFFLVVQQVLSEDFPVSENTSVLYTAAGDACYSDGLLGCSGDCKGRNFCMYGKVITVDCFVQTGRSFCSPKNLQCTSTSTSCDAENNPYFNCPGDSNFYPHALNCSKFFYCKKDQKEILDCINLIFDPKSKSCVSGIPCYTFSPVNGLCKGKEGALVPHPLEKRIFAHCSGNFPQIGECPKDLIFNPNKLSCEFDCKTVGNFEDSTDSNCYYSCSRTYTSPYLTGEHHCCPFGQTFNPTLHACAP